MYSGSVPGQLKRNARCPVCGTDLCAITDWSSADGVVREYFHRKGSPKARRKRRCIRQFSSSSLAQAERAGLETRRQFRSPLADLVERVALERRRR